MKITVLDGYTLNPGDLSWEGLRRLGEVTVYDRTPPELVTERSRGAEIIFTNKTVLGAAQLAELPDVKYIGVLATGYNVVDIAAAAQRGIVVTNIPDYGTKSVGQMTFALILELCNHVQAHSDAVCFGDWSRSRDFCFWNYPLTELAGKTIGIIGMGRIGRQVAHLADAFDMKILGYSRTQDDGPGCRDFAWAGLEELLEEADIVSLHCPLTSETKGMINKDRLHRMKKSAFLINTSRGPLINEQELADALQEGVIAGAALDVLSAEPPAEDNPLVKAKNCIITPHISWATREARSRLMDIAAENLRSYLEGSIINRVNKPA
ncbi:D-2-hydroxyacid dehydrogenase [Anaerotaenia torta]|uniref:D-2-hydroxyacid dehydrogenase n=1 Tax=Anaerotaenia torta TaxID=433293 RepID=UPI003D1F421B